MTKLGVRAVLLLLVPTLGLVGACSKEKPEYCAKLAPVKLEGTASQQAGGLGRVLATFGAKADDPVFGGMATVLKNIENDTRKSYGPALAKQLADELVTAAKAFGKTVVYDCENPPTQWEAEVKQIAALLQKEAADNDKKKAADEAARVDAEKKGDADKAAAVEACKNAALARPTGVAMDPSHYGRRAGSGRGGLMFLRKEGATWKSDALQPSDEPGAVVSQIDYVMRQDSSKCRDMGDTDDKGKTVKVKVCGWQVDVVTCDLKTRSLLGSRRLSLEVPEELSVRGTIKASADRYLAQQLWLRIEKINWQ